MSWLQTGACTEVCILVPMASNPLITRLSLQVLLTPCSPQISGLYGTAWCPGIYLSE